MDSEIINADCLWLNADIATLSADVDHNYHPLNYGLLEDHSIAVKDGVISWIGPNEEVRAGIRSANFHGQTINTQRGLITPGLIDCHTHLVYGGNRAKEFEARILGASYEQIARDGGGIQATVEATRMASTEQLINTALPRLRSLCEEGVTTVEIKSGYGLTIKDEIKMLSVAKSLSSHMPVNIQTTLLAAHTLPAEYQDKPDRYIDLICEDLIPEVAEQNLADAVDVFCDRIGFSVEHCERIFIAAQHNHLPIKAHVDQLSHLGGASLAANYGALSVDHCEYLDHQDIQQIQQQGTVVCLLPGAYYFLQHSHKPPVEELRLASIPIAIGTDLNPGSSPMASLRLNMNMASILFGLSPLENLHGVTTNGAKALGLGATKGQLKVGYDADFLVWDIDDPGLLSYEVGPKRLMQRVINGHIENIN